MRLCFYSDKIQFSFHDLCCLEPPPKIDQTKAKSQILKHLNNSVMLPPTVVGFQSENQLSPTAASPSSTVVPSPILNNSQPSFPGGGENNRQGRPILGRKYEPNGGKPHEPSYSHTDYQMFNPDTAMAASVNPISQLATGKSALNATAAEFVPRSFQPVVDPSDNQPGEIGHWSNGDWPTNVPDSISTTLAETVCLSALLLRDGDCLLSMPFRISSLKLVELKTIMAQREFKISQMRS